MKKLIAVLLCLCALFFSSCSDSADLKSSGGTTNGDAASGAGSSADASSEQSVFGSFTASDVNGDEVTDEIFAESELTMVNIWATYCGPCINEMPDLAKLGDDYASKGVRVVGIICDAVDENGEPIDFILNEAYTIIDETGADYLHILPSKSMIDAKISQVMSVPETIFLDKNGCQVGESYIGSREYEEWSRIIEQLLAKA